jgi:adenylate cyclase
MAQEIERKFLVNPEKWQPPDAGVRYRQGYLCRVKERTVRVRVAGDKGFRTVKGVNVGAVRPEYEYEIPLDDANEMLEQLCERPLIEKTRYRVSHQGMIWEVDEFEGANRGLFIAEVELKSKDQPVSIPPWVGREVTGDPRYFNANLVAHPFSEWGEKKA